ncbi:hypothetical protein ACWCPQ_15100 [Nocardia sp. NPDC001965]
MTRGAAGRLHGPGAVTGNIHAATGTVTMRRYEGRVSNALFVERSEPGSALFGTYRGPGNSPRPPAGS